MNQNIPWEKLARYFAGELPREEIQEMETWIQADREREEKVKSLYKIWKESESFPYQLDVDEAWETLERNIERLEQTKKASGQSGSANNHQLRIVSLGKSGKDVKKTGGTGWRMAMVAASVLIVLTAGFFSYHYHLENQEAEKAQELATQEFTTGDGERAVYTLGDGSRVILHAGSRIEVPVNFNLKNRELFLEGEAYFDVEHRPDAPFVVRSDEAYTRVLGTKFLVQAWPDESRNVEVIVEEGKVAFGENQTIDSSAQQEVIITRNQKGVVAAGENPTVSDITDLHWHLGWTEGRLVFEDRQLSEILPRLERWYAVEITTADQTIDDRKLTAEIDYTQPMMEVLMGIALSLDLEIVKEGRTITLRLADGS